MAIHERFAALLRSITTMPPGQGHRVWMNASDADAVLRGDRARAVLAELVGAIDAIDEGWTLAKVDRLNAAVASARQELQS